MSRDIDWNYYINFWLSDITFKNEDIVLYILKSIVLLFNNSSIENHHMISNLWIFAQKKFNSSLFSDKKIGLTLSYLLMLNVNSIANEIQLFLMEKRLSLPSELQIYIHSLIYDLPLRVRCLNFNFFNFRSI